MKYIFFCFTLIFFGCTNKENIQKNKENTNIKTIKTFSFENCERIRNEAKIRNLLSIKKFEINDQFAVFSPYLRNYLTRYILPTLERNQKENKEINIDIIRTNISYIDGFLSRTLTVKQRERLYMELVEIINMTKYKQPEYDDDLLPTPVITNFCCFIRGIIESLNRYGKSDEIIENNEEYIEPIQMDMHKYIHSKKNKFRYDILENISSSQKSSNKEHEETYWIPEVKIEQNQLDKIKQESKQEVMEYFEERKDDVMEWNPYIKD